MLKTVLVSLLFLTIGFVVGVLSADGVTEWERKFTDPPGTPQIDVEIFLVPPEQPQPQPLGPWFGPSAQYNPCVA